VEHAQREPRGTHADRDADDGIAEAQDGLLQASCGLSAATPMTTAVLIAAVSASPGRPMSVTARALSPMSAAMAQMLKGRKIR
jgi:hypothetical protein